MRILGILAVVMLAVIAAENAMAAEGHTTLLATSEPFEGGVTADLRLETRPGTGKVFIESSPLTKVDTQISTRFAKEVACNYLGRTCEDTDFFYTIRARASIIGGPSAGAAMAALTVAVLEGTELNESIAITGTINSGNIIGPVGGVAEKIEAASDAGITKVLIPKGERSSFARNASIDMVAYGNELGIEVIEVFSLDEALTKFTGKSFEPEERSIEIDKRYREVMGELAGNLCRRTEELSSGLGVFRQSGRYNETYQEVSALAENLTEQGINSMEEKSSYAAASFCFGANVRYKYLEIVAEEMERDGITEALEAVETEAQQLENGLKNATTVSDAQILAIVKDRIAETREHINTSRAVINENRERGLFEMAFATERLESAKSWNTFFGVISEQIITEEMLKDACLQKVAEAQERVEYSTILIQGASRSAQQKLAEAQRHLDRENYVQCLHQATVAKSEASTLLSVYGVRDEEVQGIVERKIKAAQATIARQAEKDIFPVVGYSYFEYANSLKETDKYSALLFSDYALEFSNLDIYFKEASKANATSPGKETKDEKGDENSEVIILATVAVVVGVLAFSAGRMTAGRKKRILINTAKKAKKHVKKAKR